MADKQYSTIGFTIHPHAYPGMHCTRGHDVNKLIIKKDEAEQRFVVLAQGAVTQPCPKPYFDYDGIVCGDASGEVQLAGLNWVLGKRKSKNKLLVAKVTGGEFAACMLNFSQKLLYSLVGYRNNKCLPAWFDPKLYIAISILADRTIVYPLKTRSAELDYKKVMPSFKLTELLNNPKHLWQLGLYLWHPGITVSLRYCEDGELTLFPGRSPQYSIYTKNGQTLTDKELDSYGFSVSEYGALKTLAGISKMRKAVDRLVKEHSDWFDGLINRKGSKCRTRKQ